jgi:hypothetical protein
MNDLSNDPDVAAMKRTNKKPLLVGAGIVAGILLLGVLFLFTGAASVRTSLVEGGYTDVDVKINGPFEYGFTAKKGTSTCGGVMTKTPFSSSRTETCFGH